MSISTLPALGNYILLNVFTIFKQKHPQVNLSIKEDDNSNIMKELETGEIDVGLIGLFQYETAEFFDLLQQKDLYYQELFADELCIYASKNNPLSNKKSIYLSETYDYPLIIYKNNVLDKDFVQLNLNHNNILRFNDRESMKQMVSSGNALAIFPRITSVNDLYVASGNLVPLNIIDFKIPLYMGIVFNGKGYLSNIQYEFIKILEEQLESVEQG
nr:LysR family transcriptional regulator substrate-binding protein [Dehalobacterium formicoaceticum]